MKIYKALGQEGRITIPGEARLALGLIPGAILGFDITADEVVIRKEKVCSNCSGAAAPAKPDTAGIINDGEGAAKTPLLSYLDGLSSVEQMAALIHLTDLWVRGREAG